MVATERPDRLIVCLPVGSPRAGRRPDPARERYTRFRSATAGILPGRLPPSADGAAFLYFETDWTPRLLLPGDAPTGSSPTQSAALRQLAHEFRRWVMPA